MSPRALYRREGALGRIVLASPETGNALGVEMAQDLLAATRACQADQEIRAVLITALGGNFCVGGDISLFRSPRGSRSDQIGRVTGPVHAAESILLGVDLPIVTAVQGAAAGAGISLALLGDVVLAGADACLVPAFTALGLSADGGSTWILPRLVGARRAAELLITGRRLNAETALAWGLFSEICPHDALAAHAESIAVRLSNGPTAAFRTVKRLLRRSDHSAFQDQVALEARMIAEHANSPDGEEGVSAFLQKRPPRFQGQGGPK